MSLSTATVLEPRKTPVQARSAASVDAIVEATFQVLVAVGKERLTTTRVAARAGVSVGTLYQYFPNKSSLLQAALRHHFDEVEAAVTQACEVHCGATLDRMGTGLASAFLAAKMKDPKTSAALYAVSSDVDGVRLALELSRRTHQAVMAMLRSAPEGLSKDPALIATILQGTMGGVSRRLLESECPGSDLEPVRKELTTMVCAYLNRCSLTSSG